MRFSSFHRRLTYMAGGCLIALWLASFFAPWPWMRIPQRIQHAFLEAGTRIFERVLWWSASATITPEELAALQAQRDAYATGYAQALLLEEENAQLRDLLNFLDRQPYVSATALVISRSISPVSTTFVIDRGSTDGLYEGAPVIVGQGVLIGKVVGVGMTTSTVRSLTDTASATAVSLLHGTSTMGIAQGEGNQVIKIRYIPQTEQVEIQDMVVTSGLESLVPSGLVIGTVTQVIGEASSPFQEAIVEPLADPRTEHIVSVLLLKEDL
jgi:rod shape-determining protein MreC